MSNQTVKHAPLRRITPSAIIVALAIFFMGVGLTWWTLVQKSSQMREDLLSQAQLVAQGLNSERIKELTGTEADLKNPIYSRLKEQLTILRSANQNCRFLYLLGQKSDGKVFFFVDSESVNSQDYSPPGQVYDEVPTEYRRVLSTRTMAVAGPVADRWGTWVTGLVPIIDQHVRLEGLAPPAEAQALVQKAVEFYRKNGKKDFLQEINNTQGDFHKGNLYAFVYDPGMTMLAHPIKPELVGKNQLDKKDWSGGKLFRKEIQDLALSKGRGWVDYEYENPITGLREPKTTYIEHIDDLIICAGSYRVAGSTLAVLGMDIDARDWYWRLVKAVFPPALFTFLLIIIQLAGSVFLSRRASLGNVSPSWMHHLEVGLVILVGLLLTIFSAWMVHRHESRTHREAFIGLAGNRTINIATALKTLRDTELESLSRFYDGNDTVTQDDFQTFSQFLIKNPIVSAWEWIPVVPEAEKTLFEMAMWASGMLQFEIWQKDGQGRRQQAFGRRLFYPVLFVAPSMGNEKAIGYDLGSEPLRLAALEEARATGLSSATEPLTLVQETENQQGMLIFHSVYRSREFKQLRGVVLAVLRLGALLKSGLSDNMVAMEISLLQKENTAEALAVSWDADSPPSRDLSLTRPVFAFGRVFAVKAYAGSGFVNMYPTWNRWLALVIGITLTVAVAISLSATLRRRQHLERLVLLRTKELQERERSYHNQFANNSSVMLLIDRNDGKILDANIKALSFYGYTLEQMLSMHIYDINTLPRSEILKDMASVKEDSGKHFSFQHRLVDGSVRDVEVSTSSISFGDRMVLHSIVQDVTERKAVEKALQNNEAWQRQLLANLPAGVIIIDPSTRLIEQINEYAAVLFGAPVEHLVGHRCHSLLCPVNEGSCPVCDLGQSIDNSVREMMRFDGSCLAILKTVRRIQLNGREKLLECFVDISDRKRMEEDLRLASDRLNLAARAGGVGIWEYDTVQNKLEWDEQMFRLYGITGETFSGAYEAWQAGLHPDDRVRGDQEINLALLGEKEFDTEFRVVWPDGTIRSIRALALVQRDVSGSPLRMIGTNWDISEQKRAEEALNLERNRLAGIIEGTNAGTWEWNVQTGEILFNARWAEIIGYTLDEISPLSIKTWLQFVHPDDHIKNGELLDKHFCKELDYYEVESRMRHKIGHWIWILVRGKVTLWGEDGKPMLMQGILQDITQRKLAEEDLLRINSSLKEATTTANKMKREADMANAAKSEFLANMSHEIRTPMNGVIGMTGLLLDTRLNDDQRHYADLVRSSAESLLGLLNDILDFSKIEAKKLDLEVLDFNLSRLLDDFSATLAVKTEEKGLELLSSLDPDVPEQLFGDPGRLRQILTNLANNAIKFTARGEIVISVTLVEDSTTDALLRFSVRDTGIGIPAEKTGLLFNQFTQVDASTTRKYGGTGLGLAISKQLAELMGGEIGMMSKEGIGSEFWFTARFGKQTSTTEEEIIPLIDLHSVRILVVDDNATNRELLINRLTFWGMRPAAASDGAEALLALRQAIDEGDPFRIAILDMQMPGMDGEELGRMIKADSRMKDTRLVMLTSLGSRGDVNRLKELGFTGYATKPVRHSDLRAILSLSLKERDPHSSDQQSLVTRHTAREIENVSFNSKARILLVEDNITNQQVALGILKKFGLVADAMANGQEALHALRTIPYDLVLMDVQMPVMGGLEATREIRSLKSTVLNPHIPVIAMTANAMQGDREECLQAGMNSYLSKPVTPLFLAKALEIWLPVNNTLQGEQLESTQTPVSASDLTVFDKAGMVERLMDDEELVRIVVKGFLDDLPKQIIALKKYLEIFDTKASERQAHTIKGASANVGGIALGAVAYQMEIAARAGDLDKAESHLAELERQFDLLKQAIAVNYH